MLRGSSKWPLLGLGHSKGDLEREGKMGRRRGKTRNKVKKKKRGIQKTKWGERLQDLGFARSWVVPAWATSYCPPVRKWELFQWGHAKSLFSDLNACSLTIKLFKCSHLGCITKEAHVFAGDNLQQQITTPAWRSPPATWGSWDSHGNRELVT